MNRNNPSLPASTPGATSSPKWQPGCRQRLLGFLAGAALGLLAQAPLLAQNLNLINVDLGADRQFTGAAARGLPGDVWNYFFPWNWATPLSCVDAQGNPTAVSVRIDNFGWVGNNPLGSSPQTINLLADYMWDWGPPINFEITGLEPNMNYVVVMYMAGDNPGHGGTVNWLDWRDGVTTNRAATSNSPITTKASFVEGQNFAVIVAHSDPWGTIPLTVMNGPGSSMASWNGLQLQLAPDLPVTYDLPRPQTVFAGRAVSFTSRSAGLPPLTYQWQLNGVNLSDGGGVAGSTTPVLNIASVPAGVSTVSLIVANANGAVTNSTTLTGFAPAPGSYAAAINNINPTAYWSMNELLGSGVVSEHISGRSGAVGAGVALGEPGTPNPPFVGFDPANTGARFSVNNAGSFITIPPLDLNTNRATFTAWIRPDGSQNPGAALFLTRSGTGGAGLNYGPAADTLGYTWNSGASATHQWNSGVTVPPNLWSFVALVVEPDKATLYVFNPGGISAAVNPIRHSVEAWRGNALIGADPADMIGAANFNGTIDEVAAFNRALSSGELLAIYSAGLGGAAVPPTILVQPSPRTVSRGAIVQFNAVAIGTAPLSYQWQRNGVNLSDDGRITGAATPTLSIADAGAADTGNYRVIVTGAVAPVATSSAAALGLSPLPLLFNVDINSGGSPTRTGASVLGQAGDLWNGINTGAASGLLDYSGAPSALVLTLAGAGFWSTTGGGTPTTDTLMEDYAHGGELGVSVSGLHTNAVYTVVVYSGGDQVGQGGTFSGGLSGAASGEYRDPLAQGINYLAFTNVIAAADGRLNFQIRQGPLLVGPGILNGLQIQRQDISAAAPMIAMQPVSVTNYSGFTHSLTVRAVSDSAITYQWRRNGVNLVNGGNISGATSATLTFNPLAMGNAGEYTVVLANANGSVTSAATTLTVLDAAFGWRWSPPVPITTAEATLLLPGRITGAASFGLGTELQVTLTNANNMVVTFTSADDLSVASGPVGGRAVVGGFTGSGNTQFDTLMSAFGYNMPAGPHTIRLFNLTPGLRYTAQFFALDMRVAQSPNRAFLQDPVVPGNVSAIWEMGDAVYVTGSFTAADTTQTAILQLPGTADGRDVNSGNLNALVVRLDPPKVRIINNGNGTVTVNWDQTVDGVGPARLESTTSLSGAPTWTDLGASGSVTVPVSGSQFFRAVLP